MFIRKPLFVYGKHLSAIMDGVLNLHVFMAPVDFGYTDGFDAPFKTSASTPSPRLACI